MYKLIGKSLIMSLKALPVETIHAISMAFRVYCAFGITDLYNTRLHKQYIVAM